VSDLNKFAAIEGLTPARHFDGLPRRVGGQVGPWPKPLRRQDVNHDLACVGRPFEPVQPFAVEAWSRHCFKAEA